ncbi:hypothetical protein B0H16DRAFT_233245 [Mycena metata]|uniref:Uncharacterized protein n=1 Tax=Mycena metata TaxID=1033252 RepID=A0AAD7HUW6_9AGAR|nr:hypothetical protein B0H16DRAFT_233245 [Mycena metata]
MNPLESNLEMCVKDVVDLGRKIEDSLAKIRVNKQRAGELAVHSRDIITKLQDCADGKLNNTPPIALVGALNDLKLQLKRIHNECQPVISAHIWAGAQPLKLSMKRATFEAEVKELKQHGDKCYALFASLRKGAPSIDVARGTEDLSSEIADITARMEGSGLEIKHIPQVEGHVPEIAEGIDQIERGVHYAETVHYPSVQAPQMSYSGVHVSQRPNDRADVNISGGIGGDGGRGGNIGGQGGVGEGNKIEIKASHNRSVQFFNLPDPEAQSEAYLRLC